MKRLHLGFFALIIVVFAGCLSDSAKRFKKDPFTWDNAAVYFVFTDRFFNGDESNDINYGRRTDYGNDTINTAVFHGGDLAGLTQKLSEGYFTDLGINVIWLTGVYEQIHGFVGGGSENDFPHYAYHGYYPMDWTMTDKNFGTIEEFRAFVDLAHSQNIRIVMDAGLNHPGYPTMLDCVQFKFGGNSFSEEEAVTHTKGWDFIKKYEMENDSAWAKWWGNEWVRTADETTKGGILTESIAFLPDFRTDSKIPVKLPVFLKTKWSMEEDSAMAWINPSALELRKELNVAPADYLIKWISAWVREFGIDGFRCDVVENVDLFRWKQLKEQCNKALKEWRKNNREKAGADWQDDFWMTGDFWDAGIDFKKEYADAGFNSMVNFTFPKDGDLKKIGPVWQKYADELNTNAKWNTLSFLNSAYKRETDPANMINCATSLMLSPGAVQIFYGDENARLQGSGRFTSDPVQGYRSDYKWGENPEVLRHWQKLGQFRRNHPAVGAGKQLKIRDNAYARTFEQGKYKDRVIIIISENNEEIIEVGSVFKNGELVRNFYDGIIEEVIDGKVKFKPSNSIILLESF